MNLKIEEMILFIRIYVSNMICRSLDKPILNRAASRKQFPIILSQLPPEEIAAFHSDDPTFFQKHGVLFSVLREKDLTGFERLWDKALKQRKQ